MRFDELSDGRPTGEREAKLIQRFKEGEQDPIVEWFGSEYSFREFRGRGHEMIDRIVDKLES